MSKELKEKAMLLQGCTVYALGHLDDTVEHGYNDKSAIGNAVDAIDMIIKGFDELEYIKSINKKELKAWKEELLHAGKDDAYTSAIAQALKDIADNVVEAIKESDEN